MTRRVFNYGGGMHSPAALTQFIRDALDGEVANGMEAVAGSGMNVTVKSGTASVGKDPSYDINIIGTESVSIGAASPSNPMNALIVAYVDRDIAGSTAVTDNTNDVFKLKVVSGAAAATPSDPTTSAIQAAIGAANPFIVLARVRKRAGATSVIEDDITDLRKMITLRAGRINDSDIISDGVILPQNLSPEARCDYSAEETDTGRKWVDNKIIYQKTVSIGQLPAGGNKSVAHNTAGIDRIVGFYGTAVESGNTTISLPFIHESVNGIKLTVDKANVNIGVSRNWSQFGNGYVTILYTKV